MKRILLYNDSEQIGGHEVLSVEIAEVLSKNFDVVYIASCYNQNLLKRLKTISKVNVVEISYKFNRLQIFRNFFPSIVKKKIRNYVKQFAPDLCIAIQGTIDTSFLVFPICRKYSIPIVSYIPIAFDLRKVSKHPKIGFLKDIILHYYYRYPDYFITINEFLADNIRRKSDGKKVFVVPNGVDWSAYHRYDRNICRLKYNIDNDKIVIAYVGRLEFWHKGLDFYLSFLSKVALTYSDIIFLFVGAGPASNQVNVLSKQYSNIKHIDWTDNISEIYSMVDCLIQPSRFESGPGCPITLLEALYFKLPVIASDIPEFRFMLPSSNLFPIGNEVLLGKNIEKAKRGELKIVDFDSSAFSLQKFKDNFAKVINDILMI